MVLFLDGWRIQEKAQKVSESAFDGRMIKINAESGEVVTPFCRNFVTGISTSPPFFYKIIEGHRSN